MSVAQLLLNRGANVNFTPKVSVSQLQDHEWHLKGIMIVVQMLCAEEEEYK